MKLDVIISVMVSLIGFPTLWATVIDVLKLFGVVTDGTSGKWSAILNLVTLLVVAVIVNFFPSVNMLNVDNLLLQIAKFMGLMMVYLVQLWGAQKIHNFLSRLIPKLSFKRMKELEEKKLFTSRLPAGTLPITEPLAGVDTTGKDVCDDPPATLI